MGRITGELGDWALAATALIPSPAKPDINPRRESPWSKFCLIDFFTAFLQRVLAALWNLHP
jgi:hypothetical protein